MIAASATTNVTASLMRKVVILSEFCAKASKLLAQKDADDGCLWAVSRLLDDGQVPPSAVWRKARAALLAGKTPLARAAVALLHPKCFLTPSMM